MILLFEDDRRPSTTPPPLPLPPPSPSGRCRGCLMEEDGPIRRYLWQLLLIILPVLEIILGVPKAGIHCVYSINQRWHEGSLLQLHHRMHDDRRLRAAVGLFTKQEVCTELTRERPNQQHQEAGMAKVTRGSEGLK